MPSLGDVLAGLHDGRSLILGSGGDAGLRLPGPGVDARHARLSRLGEEILVQDLDSAGGTFVNDREVRGLVTLRPGDRLRVGGREFLIPGRAQRPRDFGGGRASAVAVNVVRASRSVGHGGGTRVILADVSFRLGAGQFLGILGASGSGKSTLVGAIAGLVGLSGGAILLDGRAGTPADLRSDRRVAYLPQDVVIHEALTPAVALDFVARIKGLGKSPGGRRVLARAALDRVGLADHARTPIHRLSGGQRKRAALAAELLGDPGLILLDEATSGLDPATESEMMALFRSLAGEGRTVLCVTHSPARLDACDRLLFLMQGRCVFFGTPREFREFFGVVAIEEAYAKLAGRPPGAWEAAFNASAPGRAAAREPAMVPEGPRASTTAGGPPHEPFARRALDLLSRNLRLQLADARNLLLLSAQGPAIALMVAVTFGSIRSGFAERHAADTKQVTFVLVLAALWCAGTASVREVVRELPIVRHESRFGLGLAAYLVSKFALLAAFAVIQSAALLLAVRWFTELPGPADAELLVLAFAAAAGVALGLLVSSLAGTSERAMTILPVLLVGQAIFSGGLARLTGWARCLAMACVPAYWALDGLRSQLPTDLANATYPGAPGHYQPPILGPGGPLALDLSALAGQAVVLLVSAYVGLSLRIAGGPRLRPPPGPRPVGPRAAGPPADS